jgi:hypothetical protein
MVAWLGQAGRRYTPAAVPVSSLNVVTLAYRFDGAKVQPAKGQKNICISDFWRCQIYRYMNINMLYFLSCLSYDGFQLIMIL